MPNTIPEIFFDTAQKYSDKTALLYKKEGVYFPVTYKELARKVTIINCGLQNLGVKKGDKVAILSENRPEWVISDLAIMMAGAIVVPLHTTFSPEAICRLLIHAKVKVLIVSNSGLLNKILLQKKKLKHLEKIIFINNLTSIQKKSAGKKLVIWRNLMARKIISCDKISLNPNDYCSIIYTSGTTGKPKGVLLTHENFLSNIHAVNKYIPVKQSDIFLSFLPLSHVLERTGGYYLPLFFGATIAYAEHIKQLRHNLKEVTPTVLISVPRIFEKLHDGVWDKVNASSPFQKKFFNWALKQKRGTLNYRIADLFVFKKIRRQLGGNLRLTICGGASSSKHICEFFYTIGILILEGYGLTETSPVISVNQEKNFKFGTVGRILPGVQVQISPESEIWVKGPGVFRGYFDNDRETYTAFEDAWFCTGDLGFIDDKGFLTVTGRKKEMIVLSNGKKVWPESVENLLNNDKYISQSMALGTNQKSIFAVITPDWQEIEIFLKKNNLPLKPPEKLVKNPMILSLFQKRIDEKINPKLSDFEKIRKFILLPQEFSQERGELTPTLKLRRHIITDHYKHHIESLYA